MQTIEYRFVDKSAWGHGPWQLEPDKRQWLDPQTGLPCIVRRSPALGFLCGYVGVPRSHPAYRKDCDAVDVSVHGGLTFSDTCSGGDHDICHKVSPGEDDDVWWLGFDCGHFSDATPGMMSLAYRNIYRDFPYVVNECEGLARQLKAMTETTK